MTAGSDASEEVARLRAERDAARKELEAFTYAVSHDLRAPIRSIRGFAQILEEDYLDQLDEEGKDSLQRVISSAAKISDMVDALLTYSRLGRKEVDKKTIDLSAMAREVAGDFALPIEVDPGLSVSADPELMHQLLEILADNSRRYGAKSVRLVSQGSNFVWVDDGPGFDPKDVEKVFNPFESVHHTGQQTLGMGLAYAKRIVQLHGGTIQISTAPGQGTSVSFEVS
jgi:signal transduction histidine kinase